MEPATPRQPLKIGQAAVLLSLFAMLLFAVIWASMAWTSAEGAEMSIHGWIALTLGVVFSLVIGCGLMILMFYSSRSGYDETASPDFRPKKPDADL
jgi:heme/copper-type cytochrome/quinol oxidase subunit 2